MHVSTAVATPPREDDAASARTTASFASAMASVVSQASRATTKTSTTSVEALSGGAVRHHMDVKCDCAPPMDHVIYGYRARPYTLRDLRSFLEAQHADESLDFLLGVLAVHAEADAGEAVKKARALVQDFVVPGAKHQVNLPHRITDELVRAAAQPDWDAAGARVDLAPAFTEIWRLVENDGFARFLKEVGETNISTPNARLRLGVAVFSAALASMFVVVGAVVGPFWIAAFAFSSWFGAAIYTLNWYTRVCDGLARARAHMVDPHALVTWACFHRMRTDDERLEDEFAINALRATSKWQERVALGVAVVLEVAGVLLAWGLQLQRD